MRTERTYRVWCIGDTGGMKEAGEDVDAFTGPGAVRIFMRRHLEDFPHGKKIRVGCHDVLKKRTTRHVCMVQLSVTVQPEHRW